MTEIMQKLAHFLEENEEGAVRAKAAQSKEEVLRILAEYDIVMTAEQFDQMRENVLSDELTPEMLDLVSGGGWWGKAWQGVKDFFQGFLDAF